MSSSISPYVIALRPNTPAPNAAPPNPALPPFDYVTGGGARFPTLPGGLSIMKPPYGKITAYDMNKGTIAWQIANGDTPANVKNNPLLQGLNIPKTGTARLVGLLLTKTLLFLGEGSNAVSGTPQKDWAWGRKFRAYDKATGAVIAEIELPSGTTGAPMTYLHKGKQYIVVAVGARDHPAEYVALALP